MNRQLTDYVSPSLEARALPQKGGYGVFARAPIATGELLIVWSGDIVTREGLMELPPEVRMYSIQVEENCYQVSTRPPSLPDYLNHSCDPNAGLSGQIALVAMRDITPGEEICFDYAMSDGSPYDEFMCQCGAANCRGRVTGDDWQLPELQERYAGYFSPYLQRRIAQRARVRANGYARQQA